MDTTIRTETAEDARTIEAMTVAAFLDAAHTSHTEQFIVAGLRRAGKLAVSLVAESDGVLVGHVAVSPVRIADGTAGWFGLGPISVLPVHQRRGIGTQLMHAALDRLRSARARGCVVLGEPAYYGRFGFRADPGLVLPGVPPEYFQAIVFSGARPQGVVRYDAAFEARA
jgi:putative acetyltransferase